MLINVYVDPTDYFSMAVCAAFFEKGVSPPIVEIEDSVIDRIANKDLPLTIHPPIIEDRSIGFVYGNTTILEYLEECYPYKPLFPISLVERTQTRINIWKLCKTIGNLIDYVRQSAAPGKRANKKNLAVVKEHILTYMAPYLNAMEEDDMYLGEEFSMLDILLVCMYKKACDFNILSEEQTQTPYFKTILDMDSLKKTNEAFNLLLAQ